MAKGDENNLTSEQQGIQKSIKKILTEIESLEKKSLDRKRKTLEVSKLILEQETEVLKESSAKLQISQKNIELLKEIKLLQNDLSRLENQRIQDGEDLSDLYNQELQLVESLNEAQGQGQKQILENLKAVQKEIPLLEKKYQQAVKAEQLQKRSLELQQKLNKEQKASVDNLKQSTKGLIAALTGVDSSYKKTFLGSFAEVLGTTGMEKGSISKGLKRVKAGLTKNNIAMTGLTFTSNVLGSTMMKVVESSIFVAKAQDEAVSSFIQSTGALEKYSDQIVKINNKHRTLGLTVGVTREAYQALYQQSFAFTRLQDAEREELTKTAGVLKRLGISADSSAKIFDISIKTFGGTADAAKNLALEIKATADALGVSSDAMARDFTNAMKTLAAQGNKAIPIFKKLAAQAKVMGVEFSTLLSFTEQFDTFDTAAESVGKLNALLGGPYLNSVQLVNATEEERVMIIRRSLQMAGKQFGSMSKFEQKAIAAAAGIRDMDTANRMFGASIAEMRTAQMDAMFAKITEKEAEDRAQKALSIAESFAILMESFAVDIKPLLDVVKGIIIAFADFINWIPGGTKLIVGVGIAIAGISIAKRIMAAMTKKNITVLGQEAAAIHAERNAIQLGITAKEAEILINNNLAASLINVGRARAMAGGPAAGAYAPGAASPWTPGISAAMTGKAAPVSASLVPRPTEVQKGALIAGGGGAAPTKGGIPGGKVKFGMGSMVAGLGLHYLAGKVGGPGGEILSVLGNVATYAGIGAAFGVPGAIIGGALGLLTSIFDGPAKQKTKKDFPISEIGPIFEKIQTPGKKAEIAIGPQLRLDPINTKYGGPMTFDEALKDTLKTAGAKGEKRVPPPTPIEHLIRDMNKKLMPKALQPEMPKYVPVPPSAPIPTQLLEQTGAKTNIAMISQVRNLTQESIKAQERSLAAQTKLVESALAEAAATPRIIEFDGRQVATMLEHPSIGVPTRIEVT